jgi:hypothetical protein
MRIRGTFSLIELWRTAREKDGQGGGKGEKMFLRLRLQCQ